MQILGMALHFIGIAGFVPPPVPEIDPVSAGTAVAFLACALLVLNGRRK